MTKIDYKKNTLENLIVLAQKDDLQALEEIIKREQKNVFATFSYLVTKKENISDLTQEALFRVAKNIKTLKNPKAFKSWLNHIITNLFYDEIRKKERAPEIVYLDDSIGSNFTQLIDVKCKPNERCLAQELEKIIKNAILSLPDQFRIPIILREFQGLSYEEIADVTSTNIGTVKSRIARARNKLQDGLKTYI